MEPITESTLAESRSAAVGEGGFLATAAASKWSAPAVLAENACSEPATLGSTTLAASCWESCNSMRAVSCGCANGCGAAGSGCRDSAAGSVAAEAAFSEAGWGCATGCVATEGDFSEGCRASMAGSSAAEGAWHEARRTGEAGGTTVLCAAE